VNKPSVKRKPRWLKRDLPVGPAYEKVRTLLKNSGLNTVCQEAKCPNIWECFSNHTSTFLIMGPNCTRNCKYCNVTSGLQNKIDPDEPSIVAKAAKILGLTYVVVTSVTRDDLPDGGAGHFAKTINEIKRRIPGSKVEVLIPDLQGSKDALIEIVKAKPDVLNHNIETVSRLYSIARPQANYDRSLELLKRVKEIDSNMPTKSGIMLGLGETDWEIEKTLEDLLNVNCKMLTLGQYLSPTKDSIPIDRFVTPDEFDSWKQNALKMGFTQVASGPLVRSSYHANELFGE